MASMKEKYQTEIVPAMREKFGYTNPMVVPRISKIVLNMGFGILDKDAQQTVVSDLAKLSGQQPTLRPARKSISNFKLRDGMIVGAKVTLRGKRMYDFLERLIHVSLPRIRDFRGVPVRGFDGQGNYTMGITEHSVFPEVSAGQGSSVEQGLDITFVTTAKTNEQARELLTQFGMPFAGRQPEK